jgi:hypothetical protein
LKFFEEAKNLAQKVSEVSFTVPGTSLTLSPSNIPKNLHRFSSYLPVLSLLIVSSSVLAQAAEQVDLEDEETFKAVFDQAKALGAIGEDLVYEIFKKCAELYASKLMHEACLPYASAAQCSSQFPHTPGVDQALATECQPYLPMMEVDWDEPKLTYTYN